MNATRRLRKIGTSSNVKKPKETSDLFEMFTVAKPATNTSTSRNPINRHGIAEYAPSL